MSRMPGIGYTWFQKYGGDVYPKDFVTVNGTKYRPSRYYDSLYARKNPYKFDQVKQKRKDKSVIEFPEDREAISRNKFREAMTNQFKRDLK